MRTHFSGALGEDEAEQAMCGTWYGDASNSTGNWSRVDCRKCLKHKHKFTKQVEAEERAIVEQMGDMAKFMKQQEGATPSPDAELVDFLRQLSETMRRNGKLEAAKHIDAKLASLVAKP
jgi:hypothetical protein